MTFTLVQVTDMHLFEQADGALQNLATFNSYQQVIERAKQVPADAMILTGDLSHDGSKFSYQHIINSLKDYTAPIHYIVGNHDTPSTAHQTFKNSHIQGSRYFDLGDWRCIGLDSFWDGRIEGRLAQSEIDRTVNLLEEWHGHSLLYLHHNTVEGDDTYSHMLQNGEGFIAALLPHKEKIKGILCGHVHAAYDNECCGFRFLSSPSTCHQYLFENGKSRIDPVPPGFCVYTLTETGELHREVIRVS